MATCAMTAISICVLFTYFTALIVQDSMEDQPLAEGTLLFKKYLSTRF